MRPSRDIFLENIILNRTSKNLWVNTLFLADSDIHGK